MIRRTFIRLAVAAMIHPAFNWAPARYGVTISVDVIWIRVDPRANIEQLGGLYPEHRRRERPAG